MKNLFQFSNLKKLYTLLFILTLGNLNSLNAQSKVDTLNNAQIVALTKIGLQSSVIVTKIKSSIASFDVSTEALIDLSKNGVAPEVINEMMKMDNIKTVAVANAVDSKDPNVMHKSGVYYYNPSDMNNPLKRIQIVRASYQTSSAGYGGYGGSSTSAILSGLESRQQIFDQNPVFYFYFPDEQKSNDWFAASPNEFALVRTKAIPKKEIRSFKVGGSSSGVFGSSSDEGVPEKMKLPFDFKEISDGIYKITFGSPLEYGEYCFTYAHNTSTVFDFGIKEK